MHFMILRAKTASFLMTLATMMVPFQVIMVPLFLVVYKMGMYDTYWGLIIPRVAVAGSIFYDESYVYRNSKRDGRSCKNRRFNRIWYFFGR